MKALLASLRPLFGENPPWLVDVGAAMGIHPRWNTFGDLIHVVGFEPNPDEFRKLEPSTRFRWVQAAVSTRRETRTLFLTRRFNNCSLLRPNLPFIAELDWEDHFEVVGEESIDCVSLDEALGELGVRPSFLKLDTQGNELEILEGASRCLGEDVVFVEVECEFCQLYQNQPLFADVDQHLRQRGFYLHDMANMLFVKPRGLRGVGGPKGRIIQADCLYFKQAEALTSAPDGAIAATIAAYVAYGFPDAAIHFLDELQRQGRAVPDPGILRKSLLRFHHSSRRLAWLPGKSFFTRVAKRFYLDYRAVGPSVWENELGNRVG